jgi:predicted membrane protein
MNESWIIWGLLFGSIGLGFFIYGRKQRAVVPFVCGLALMIFPYFVSNTIVLVAIGIVFIIVPIVFKL